MDTTSCPECGAPAEITDRVVLESTAGPMEHVRVTCARRHWFLLPVEMLARRVGPRPSSAPHRPAESTDSARAPRGGTPA